MTTLSPHLAITSWYSPLGSTIDPVIACEQVKAAGLTTIGFLEDHPHGLFQLWKLGSRFDLKVALGLRLGDRAVYATSQQGMIALMRYFRDGYTFAKDEDLMVFRNAPEVRFTETTADGYQVLRATQAGCSMDQLQPFGAGSLQDAIADADPVPDGIFGASFDTETTHLPRLPGVDPEAELLRLVREGLRRRYGNDVPESHRARAAYEFNIIKGKGYPSYFLVVADYVNWATDHGIRTTNRGSGAGSIIAYAIGITHVDPMKFGLLFERFLNPERPSMPDFDVDFDDSRRHEVIEYIRQRHGADFVAPIITRGTLHAKAAMRDSARALGYETSSGSTVDRLCRTMPDPVFGREMPLAACFDPSHPRYEEALEIRLQDQAGTEANDIFTLALQIEGVTRNWGVHACGVAVSDVPLDTVISVVQGEDGETITGFGWEDCDYLGVPKMDILGVRTLTVISDAVRMIQERHGITINPEQLEDGDPKTYELLASGRTLGVFQLESPGMRRLLARLKPTTVHDLIALVALYRPGPMGAGTHHTFADRKNGVEKIEPLHPELAEPLAEALATTYGLVVYQEDFMNLAKILAGYSLGAADNLRRAAGKKRPEVLAAEFQNFKAGAETNGYSEEAIHVAWAAMLPFADYGFVKAHATAYGHIAYQTAWLKANYPVEFMAALMTSITKLDKLAIYLAECRWMGIEILPPDLNAAVGDFLPTEDDQIIFGISSVRAIGEGVVEAVAKERANGEFSSLGDLIRRVPKSEIKKGAWENLIRAGAFDSFEHTRLSLLNSLPNILLVAKAEEQAAAAGLPPVMPEGFQLVESGPEFTPAAKLAGEKRVLGLYITGHPLQQLWRVVSAMNPRLIKDLVEDPETGESPDGKAIKLAGIITRVNRRLDKEGQPWAIITLEDLSGELDCLIFSSGYPQVQPHLEVGRLIVTDSFIRMRDGSPSAYVNSVFVPDAPKWRRLEVTLHQAAMSEMIIGQVMGILDEEGLPELGGDGQVLLFMPGLGDELSAVEPPRRSITSRMILRLTQLLGQDAIRVLT